MNTEAEIEAKFWKALKGDRVGMLALTGVFLAAWFEGGKDDPKLQLVRLDPDRAQVWLNENSAVAAVKLLLGRDPKKEYAGKVADDRVGRH